jgi:hypothetical protein
MNIRRNLYMKIIGFSNFNLKEVSDTIIAEDLDELNGNIICKVLEDNVKATDKYYPKLVDDCYKLYEAIS